MSDTDTQDDWTTPAALALPKEGFFELEQGRFGPIFPKTPACYGFSVIAKVKPGRYAVPLGSHIRRMNPRDTAVNMNRRRDIRRGGTYGPPLPEGVRDDGVDRGIAAFIGCASLVRQFEFAQNVWANDRNFHELKNERDPIIGTQDGTLEYKVPKRPIRKRIVGLPSFTTVKGGAYFFLPGIKALRFLAGPAVSA